MDLLNIIRHQWDRVGAWVAIAVGALALLLGWLGVSREVLPAAQIPYIISGGLGGVFLLGLGAVLWLSADLRDEWRQLREINLRLGETSLDGGAPASVDASVMPALDTVEGGSPTTNGAERVPTSPKTRKRSAR
jgi:hypothetical protein